MFGNNFQEAAQASLVSMLSVCPLVSTIYELPALLCVGQVVPDLFNKLLAGLEEMLHGLAISCSDEDFAESPPCSWPNAKDDRWPDRRERRASSSFSDPDSSRYGVQCLSAVSSPWQRQNS